MSTKTISDVLIEGLRASDVSHVFGVVGDALNSVTDAIRRTNGIDWVATRHEEVAAFAAGAVAQLTGGLGVCAGTVGPGAIHLLNGLYDASKSHASVLAIIGQVPQTELGSNYFQEINNDLLFADVSVFHQTITSASQVPRVFEQAIGTAISRRGVSVVSLPGDVGPQSVPSDSPVIRAYPDMCATVPEMMRLEEALYLIESAKRVTILAGIGSAGARREVLELAERLSAPIVVTLKAKEVYDWGNPFQVGQSGLLGNPAAAEAMDKADLLFMIGTDFPYRDWYPESAKVIQLDIAADHIGRRTPVDLGLAGDARRTLGALLTRLTVTKPSDHFDQIRDKYVRWTERQQKLTSPSFGEHGISKLRSEVDNPDQMIRPEAVAASVSELADDDAIFTTDTGLSTAWFARFVHMHKRQRLLGSFNLGSMANAMPQAIGAAFAQPGRQIIAFCGDGGLTMLLGDLLTVARYRLPIKLVVFNNQQLGLVKLEQEEAGLPEFGTDLDNPDLSALAHSMGITGVRITEPAQLHTEMARAMGMAGPVLIDVMTNPREISVPPKTTPGQSWGFAIAKIKETIRSEGDKG